MEGSAVRPFQRTFELSMVSFQGHASQELISTQSMNGLQLSPQLE
jgi:hypothetical protein